jgi:hypothetical protein
LDWEELSKNPNAIQLLEQNLDKMTTKCWEWLSFNPNAIHILEKNLDKVRWDWLSLFGNNLLFSSLIQS